MLGFLGLFGLAMGGFVALRADDDDEDQTAPESALDGDGSDRTSGIESMLSAARGDVLSVVETDDDSADLDADLEFERDTNLYRPTPDGTQNDPKYHDPDQTVGTDHDDTLTGDDGDDRLSGHNGDDVIIGKSGDDILSGGDGDDTILAGDGDDVLTGEDGDDLLEGGWGDDLLTGDGGRDMMFGGWGDDVLDGRDYDESSDFLNGGEGDDILLAGRGDHMDGGGGADKFIFHVASDTTIADYDPDEDIIELTYSDTAPELTTQTDDAGLTLYADGEQTLRLAGITELDLSRVIQTRI